MDLSIIGKNIKKIRLEQSLTQEDLAKSSTVPFTTIAKLENGVIKNPSIEKLLKISGALKIPIDSLLKGVNNK